ncbi:protein rolling stone-like [Amphiura filiformis]|uniref:protein rolling stone-like n=1 Tax=Amphiura filiformis TaxID=82378 RepID=UPI003B219678
MATLQTNPSAYFFIYLTDWTVLILTIYLVVAFINLVLDRKHGMNYNRTDRGDIQIALRFRHKLQWLLLNVYMNVSILVTVIYWSFLRASIPILLDLTLHAFPCLLGLIDVIITPIPVRLQHAVYPLGYGVVYLIFTLIYWAAGGTDPNGNTGIYPGLLDWEDPGTTCITIACSMGAVLISQVILWGMFKIKMVIIRRCSSTSNDEVGLDGENTQGDSGEPERGTFYENVAFNGGDDMNMQSLSSKEQCK